MDRRQTMARFAEPDESKIVDQCTHCGQDLEVGQLVYIIDSQYRFCDKECLWIHYSICCEVL